MTPKHIDTQSCVNNNISSMQDYSTIFADGKIEITYFVTSCQILHITFPFFQLEASTDCNSDFLQIHDGASASAHMLGKYCGSDPPVELFSSHNSLYFWFHSNHTITTGGFTVHWDSRDPGKLDEMSGNATCLQLWRKVADLLLNKKFKWCSNIN